MNILQDFENKPFIEAVQLFFKQTLRIPVNELGILPTNAIDVIGENVVNSIIQDNGVYVYGVVDYEFDKNQTLKNTADVNNLKEDYAGILIIAIIIKNEIKQPSRTQLAEITRAFHRKIAAMPIIVVFKYDGAIAIANTERIPFVDKSKTGEKVGKVSMLKDVSIENPHAAHERILLELGQNKALSFNELYNHWQKTLNTKELNKKFFKKIANWYFWSVAKSKFPYEYLKSDAKHKDKTNEKLQELANQKATIRFITRIIFVWFLKEKKLIPSNLFDKDYIKTIIKDFENTGNAYYYNAILQNLFFATLNRSSEFRQFADDKGYNINKTTDYDQNSFFRYEKMFQDENLENIMKLFANIPFINGGLFDSLDIKPDKSNNSKEEIIDGFSRNNNWQATMPNYLFFENQNVDFDKELRSIYDTKKGNYEVKGLFSIFEEYKFTVEENTPLEVDVALDPYLLGEIFENLLAYYNPETGATARKGSGSFYTPQEIVNYMVEESLKTYLGTDLQDFGNLINFNDNQKLQIVKKLADVKILDPACGSGAFPMGVLYKMVDILKTIDPDNSIWKKVQHDKIIGDKIKELENDKKAIENLSDDEVRTKATKAVEDRLQDLETNFNNQHHFDDYTRKLYIIRNCIYGVDIQDVAIQISKLRFFLSLIIDQKNENINPLPNLETKFVIANTLIGIELPKFTVMGKEDHSQDQVKHLKEELKTIREKHFYVTDRKEKQNLKKQDAAKRLEIANALADSMTDYKQDDIDRLNQAIAKQQNQLAQAELMPNMVQEMIVKDLFGKETTVKVNYRLERIKECTQAIKAAQNKIASLQTNTQAEIIRSQALKIADWDIYNQNAQAEWFDSDWMFGISDGFDIVIGNPPYVDSETMVNLGLEDLREYLSNKLKYAKGNWDIYIAFFEVGHNLLSEKGNLIYITPDKWISKKFGYELRKGLLSNFIKIINSGREVFETAKVDSIITHLSKNLIGKINFYKQIDQNNFKHILEFKTNKLKDPYSFDWLFSNYIDIINKIEKQKDKLYQISICENACATSDAYLIKDLIKNNSSFIDNENLKIINTGTINKFISKWGTKEMTYLGNKYLNPIVDKKTF